MQFSQVLPFDTMTVLSLSGDCFTILDSDDLGQKDDVGSSECHLLSPAGLLGSSGSKRKLHLTYTDSQQSAQPEKEVIPPGDLIFKLNTVQLTGDLDYLESQ